MTGDDLTKDAFLGGRVQIWQPRRGYRAAMDPVFLAAACPAGPGDRVLELGCGVGVASLCLARRVPDLVLTGVERQGAYAHLARRNVAETGAIMEVVEADLRRLPAELKAQSFDHVIANPPYYPAGAGTAAADAGREGALREETPLAEWIGVARARLKPRGVLSLINAADRLPDCLISLSSGFGSITVMPLQPRVARPATRVLIRARKGAKGPFRLEAPLLIHEGERHETDGDDHSDVARHILRDGGAVPWS